MPLTNHPSFSRYDQHHRLLLHWTLNLIKRGDRQVWVMNHFFVSPAFSLKKALYLAMPKIKKIADQTGQPIWPLDPVVIAYFQAHPDYQKIWYHRPYERS